VALSGLFEQARRMSAIGGKADILGSSFMSSRLSSVACSQIPLDGDTSFSTESQGFKRELTPAQRKAEIKELQAETAPQPTIEASTPTKARAAR